MTDWLFEYSGYVVLVAFFTAFVAIALWAYLPANKKALERHKDIPFREVE